MTVSEKSWEGGRVQVTTEGGRVVEHRTTASDGRFCEQCGRPPDGSEGALVLGSVSDASAAG